jgi:peptide/nickel transport system permease protein
MIRRRRWTTTAGLILIVVIAIAAVAAPFVAPNAPHVQFDDRSFAPPMRLHVIGDAGLSAPFVYRQELEGRVSRRYRADVDTPVVLRWFSGGHLVNVPAGQEPLLILGADALGRDLFSRVLFGAQRSLAVALAGVAGALVIGALVGGFAGSQGGRTESTLMWFSDFLLALPGAYLVLVLRGLLPPVLSDWEIFLLLASLFALTAWPHAARGVRSIISVERARDYAEAARAVGAGPIRMFLHLLPAARGFLALEVVLLVPALLVAEATVSYLGLGFPEASASWGTLLQDAANVRLLPEAPWVLAPAACLFLVTLGLHLVNPERASRV